LCPHTIKNKEKSQINIWLFNKKNLPLHCYPENNLFTLKKRLIPIEDMKRSPVKAVALFFYVPEAVNMLSRTINMRKNIIFRAKSREKVTK